MVAVTRVSNNNDGSNPYTSKSKGSASIHTTMRITVGLLVMLRLVMMTMMLMMLVILMVIGFRGFGLRRSSQTLNGQFSKLASRFRPPT